MIQGLRNNNSREREFLLNLNAYLYFVLFFFSSPPNWTYTRTTQKAGITRHQRWVSSSLNFFTLFYLSVFSHLFIYIFFFLSLSFMFVRRENARSRAFFWSSTSRSAGAACTCVHETNRRGPGIVPFLFLQRSPFLFLLSANWDGIPSQILRRIHRPLFLSPLSLPFFLFRLLNTSVKLFCAHAAASRRR